MSLFQKKRFFILVISAIVFTFGWTFSADAFSNAPNAIDLIGQYTQNDGVTPDYTTTVAQDVPGLYGLSGAGVGLALDSVNHRLFVPDTNNHRVLVFNLDTSNQLVDKTPDNVLGQATFYSAIATTTQTGMNSPTGIAYDSAGQRLFVSMAGNRVLVYDVASITNGEPAINVLGQSTFTASVSTTTQSGLNSPYGLAYDSSNQRLFVAQLGNNRVTVFDVASITDGENAVAVLGQSTYTAGTLANTQAGMNSPRGVAFDSVNQRLFVSQAGNNRVTVYNATSTIVNGANAIAVLGQSTYTGTTAATTQAGMSGPRGIFYDTVSQRLFVSGNGNNRVTVYNATSTIVNGANAINVLGQSNFTGGTGANTQAGITTPSGILYDSTNNRLYVGSEGGNRILAYNAATSTIADGANAVDVIGQYTQNDGVTPDYTTGAVNDVPGLYGFNGAGFGSAIDLVNHRLFLVDAANNRVLVFNLNSSNILVDRTPDNVLGQATFYTNTANVTRSGMNFPSGVAYDSANQRLFVAELSSNRVLVFDVTSITNGENAINVLGQSTFTGSTGATTQSSMAGPQNALYDEANQRLFVADSGNSRILVYDVASITDGENAVAVLGQSTFLTSTFQVTQAGMAGVSGLAYDNSTQRLFAMTGGNRITVYDVSSITDGENAINVLGQSDFTSTGSGLTQTSMASPLGLAFDSANKRLFVADTNNYRVLVFDVVSITNGEPAVNVIGPSTFTSFNSTPNAASVIEPYSLTFDPGNQRLYVSQWTGSRTSVFAVAPISAELSTSTGSSTGESLLNNFVSLLVTGTLTGTSTVELDIIGGTATINSDYTSADPIIVTIPPGAYDGSTSTAITITAPTVINDSIVENGGETITFSLINPSNVLIEDVNADSNIRTAFTYTITDDDVLPVITFNSSSTSSTTATINWSTSQAASSSVQYGLTTSYGTTATSSGTSTHSVSLAGLTSDTTYHFRITAINAGGVIATTTDFTFRTADGTAPVISSVASSTGTSTATITWNTNEAASSTVQYGLTTGYGSTATSSGTSTHSVSLTGLTAATIYHFKINATDASLNATTTTDFTFTTATGPDIIPPVITPGATSTDITTANISWSTNESASSSVQYGVTTAYGITASSSGLTSHNVSLTSLLASTAYHYRFLAIDVAGNIATSSDYIFTTIAAPVVPDSAPTTPAVAPGALVATSASTPNQSPAAIMANPNIFVPVIPTPNIPAIPAAPALPVFAAQIAPILIMQSPGANSPVVLNIQKILNLDPATRIANIGPGSPGKETTFFGPATKVAVGKFQLKYGLVKNNKDPGFGNVGPKTKAKMNELLKGN